MDCLPGGMLDDAGTVSSCNSQAMQQVESFSFNGEFKLLAVFAPKVLKGPDFRFKHLTLSSGATLGSNATFSSA